MAEAKVRRDERVSCWPENLLEKGSKRQRREERRGVKNEERSSLRKEEEKEVEELIEAAMHSAAAVQGRAPAPSQSWCLEVKETVANHLGALGPHFKVWQLGDLLENVMTILLKVDDACRSLPTVGKRSIFPLPTLDISQEGLQCNSFLRSMVKGLNSLYGVRVPPNYIGTPVGKQIVKRLGDVCRQQPLMTEEIPDVSFDDFFRFRGINYQGEEVKLARAVTWEGISPSLPEQVASLDLRDFCTGGTLEYINNFENYLIPREHQQVGVTPKMMVAEEDWLAVATGLVERGLCEVRMERDLYHVNSKPVLNGMFAVSKQEWHGNVEICRLIMNLKPVNALCRPLESDTITLPAITTMTGFYLQEDELLSLSSEDIRCFFYLFKVPDAWVKFLGFGRAVPPQLVDENLRDEVGYLCSRVLPMGFINSVGIAQHVHRNMIKMSLGNFTGNLGGEAEIRRDRTFPLGNDLFRVYLDNFDQLRKVHRDLAELIEGKVSPLVREVRETYEDKGLPRHPKKSTVQQFQGEVQGAWLDGRLGIALAKPSKIVKYIRLGLELLREGKASQKELQVVGGGFVYLSMFKRPALCGLNHIWQMIVSLERKPAGLRMELRKEVAIEIARFITLMPLMFMNFRTPFDEQLTASDASTTGGGICVSHSLTPYGLLASQGLVRGQTYEDPQCITVLSIGLFDGISALRASLDALNVPMAGHISVEMQPEARRVVESYFPDSEFVEDVELVNEEMVKSWSLKYGTVGLVLIGSGPPCQGVSRLNADRRGALRDHRSKLFHHVPRIKKLVQKAFVWAQVHSLTENVGSMDARDCSVMNEEFEDEPWSIDAGGLSLARRPRVYWVSWEVQEEDKAVFTKGAEHKLPIKGEIGFHVEVDEKDFLEAGWKRLPGQTLPTFTTSRPSPHPMRKPAGLHLCQDHELQRWKRHQHRFPPYQYRDVHCVHKPGEEPRPPSIVEREAILGFPLGYTKQCMSKQFHGRAEHDDCRLTLLGNSWSVPVICWLLKTLLVPLGIIESMSVEQLVDRLKPGHQPSVQGLLLRPPLRHSTSSFPSSSVLVQKLFGLTSLKGEDLLIQGQTEQPLRYHRLRSSIPSKLWRWKPVAGWQWKDKSDHINVLELRAVFTTVKWRVEQLLQRDVRCIHLVDSLVTLHSLSRGRSSSRKLRRTIMRINSLLLASGLHPLWGYIDTKQNPADKPSRWGSSRRWVRRRVK